MSPRLNKLAKVDAAIAAGRALAAAAEVAAAAVAAAAAEPLASLLPAIICCNNSVVTGRITLGGGGLEELPPLPATLRESLLVGALERTLTVILADVLTVALPTPPVAT